MPRPVDVPKVPELPNNPVPVLVPNVVPVPNGFGLAPNRLPDVLVVAPNALVPSPPVDAPKLNPLVCGLFCVPNSPPVPELRARNQ